MNEPPIPPSPPPSAPTSVIGWWLGPGLMIALTSNVVLSAVLIITLGKSEEVLRQSGEAKLQVAQRRAELSSVQTELDSLVTKKDSLVSTITGWENRLKEKAAAEAAVAALEESRRQIEQQLADAGKRLDEANTKATNSEKQRIDLTNSISELKATAASLSTANLDTKAALELASAAEERRRVSTAEADTAKTRTKQLEGDLKLAKADYDNVTKAAEAQRSRNADLAATTDTLQQKLAALQAALAAIAIPEGNLRKLNADIRVAEQSLATVTIDLQTKEKRKQEVDIELTKLEDRIKTARVEAADVEGKRAISQQSAESLAATKRLLAETKALQDQLAQDRLKLVAQIDDAKIELEQLKKEAAAFEVKSEKAKNDLRKANDELGKVEVDATAARKSAKELQEEIEKLRKQKEVLEKEVGRDGAAKATPSPQP